jgi:hypothetical protein
VHPESLAERTHARKPGALFVFAVPDHRLEAKGDLPTRRHLDAAVNANRSFRSPAGFDLHANPPSIGALS